MGTDIVFVRFRHLPILETKIAGPYNFFSIDDIKQTWWTAYKYSSRASLEIFKGSITMTAINLLISKYYFSVVQLLFSDQHTLFKINPKKTM